MPLTIDSGKCQGHARCAMASPDLFDIDDSGYGVVLKPEPGPEYDAQIEQVIASCPEQAISRT
jgi:ferredoxin